MSSRSPRGSLSGASTSAEVAADFAESLKDLQNNNRYEISNLTVIAQENTEHAQDISKALETHIKVAAATRKLPALFVLDSIVKNVGTPYTVYLGRNLFSTFMDAYTLVDSATRRHMDAMLKTWKEPVPGSMDPRPVFPAETVRPIENALLKAKTAVLQTQRQPQVPFRGTATPPQHNGHFMPPPQHVMPQAYAGYGSQQPTPQPPQYGQPPPMPAQPLPQDPEELKREISSLIPRFHQKMAGNPADGNLRNQLAALEALHQLLGTKTFQPSELHAIREQVNRLSTALPPLQPTLAPQIQMRPTPQPGMSTPQWQPPLPFVQAFQPPMPPLPPSQLPPPQAALVPPPMTPAALNGLQALLANVQKPSTPQMRAAVPGLQGATHSQLNNIQQHTASATPASNPLDLLSSLTKAGLINPATASTPLPSAATPGLVQPHAADPSAIFRALQSVQPTQGVVPSQFLPSPAAAASSTEVAISAASLKVFRPDLVRSLYDAQANQCNTCGRRFLSTDEGREKKSRHLDWHFRTNQRIADPNTNRGHHRNWYVDEMDWIRHVEFDPSTTTAAAADAEANVKQKNGPRDQFLHAPAGMTRNTCNICFEEMKSSYSEDLQDWIFANAAVHNGKIVHATCLAEMTKPLLGANASALAAALASVPGRKEGSATPDSLLGKRKAETALAGAGAGARLRME